MATRFLIPMIVCGLLISSCKTSQLSSFSDDVYADPSELKLAAKAKAEEQAKSAVLEQQRLADSAAAQKARDNANPYYKDPSYNQDDYYDYAYASRINRFNNPVSGAGYYDNYYTNMYTYNQNPACYGTSIYSTYNYNNMPSAQFGMMSAGYGNSFYNGYSMSYGYGGNPYGTGYSTYPYSNYYNPYSYTNYYASPYNYNPYYGAGYYNGYTTGYNSSYYNNGGYLNTYDPNSGYASMEITPRAIGGQNGGGRNSGIAPQSNGGGRQQLYNSYVEQQNNTPRFSNTDHRTPNRTSGYQPRENNSQNVNYNGGNNVSQNQQPNNNGNARPNNSGNRMSSSRSENNSNSTNRSSNSDSENSNWNFNNTNNSSGGYNNNSSTPHGGENGGGARRGR